MLLLGSSRKAEAFTLVMLVDRVTSGSAASTRKAKTGKQQQAPLACVIDKKQELANIKYTSVLVCQF